MSEEKKTKKAKNKSGGVFSLLLKIPLRWLIASAFGIVIVAVLALVIFAASDVSKVAVEAKIMKEQTLGELRAGENMRYHVAQAQRLITEAALSGNKEALSAAEEMQGAFYEDMGNLLSQYSEREEEEKAAQIQSVATDFNRFVELGSAVVEARQAGNKAKAAELMGELGETAEAIVGGLEGFTEQLNFDMEENFELVTEHLDTVKTGLWLMIGIVLLVGVLANILFQVVLLKRIRPILDVVGEWATGSMEPRVLGIPCRDELGKMAYAVNDFGDKVEAFLSETSTSLDALGHGDLERRIDNRGLSEALKQVADAINNSLNEVAHAHR